MQVGRDSSVNCKTYEIFSRTTYRVIESSSAVLKEVAGCIMEQNMKVFTDSELRGLFFYFGVVYFLLVVDFLECKQFVLTQYVNRGPYLK
jgi:hypothetical protein